MTTLASVLGTWRVVIGASAFAIVSLLFPAAGLAGQTQAEQGEALFKTICVACHTVGGGRLVGPDLSGVTERRDEDWIIRFVQHSQQVIKSGDPTAVALAADFPGLVMPDNAYTDDQVRAIMAFIEGAPTSAQPAPAEAAPATEDQVVLGQGLFQGTTRLTNGGPSCNSCHDVTNDAVIGGGVLAKELTTVFTRLGGPGVRAILGSPPFPVMQRAYRDKPLTEDEVAALVGFLEEADAEQAFHQPRDYGPKLFGAGVLGAAILLALYSLLWSGRKKGSVNQAIYDRQVKSI
jgi:mono/diheme cytochrome c family protein